jgi:hypothetical protein
MAKHEKSDDYVAPGFFFELTKNQKYAIIYFLSTIATSDVDIHSKITEAEFYFMNFYYKEFDVSVEQYLAYVAMGGKMQVVADLKSLSKLNMQGLVFATSELCDCSGHMNDDEMQAIESWTIELGITLDEWADYYENFDAFNERFP